jgi:octaprenyl-diphosphate synthase
MRVGSPEQAAIVRDAIEGTRPRDFASVVAVIRETGALDYARAAARREAGMAQAALDCLKDSQYRESLIGLAAFAVARTH